MDETVFEWAGLPARTVIPGFRGRFIHSGAMTFALWDIEEGARLPEHAHVHEQVVHLLEGRFALTIDGETFRLGTGTVAVIPPNALHSGVALTPCRILDVFAPVREDYKGLKPMRLRTALDR
jgi:quercetin dioxygenase-like cupin family protein